MPTTNTPSTKTTPDTEQDTILRVNESPVDVLGAEIDTNNITVQFKDENLHYPIGVDGELLAVAADYKEVTESFEERFSSAYRFHAETPSKDEWFHKADFWPYSDDSEENLFHKIPHSYTHTRSVGVTMDGPGSTGDISYPFTEHSVISYLDPDEKRVRVFAADQDAPSASDVVRQVFHPALNLYVALDGELLRLTIRAKSYTDPHSDVAHDTSQINPGHLTMVRRGVIDNQHLVWKPTDYEVTGGVWTALGKTTSERTNGIRPGGFNPYHTLFLKNAVDAPKSL